MNIRNIDHLNSSPLAAALLDQSADWHAVTDGTGRLLWANGSLQKALAGFRQFDGNLPGIFRLRFEDDNGNHAATQRLFDDALRGIDIGNAIVSVRPSFALTPDAEASFYRLRISTQSSQYLWTLTDVSTESRLNTRLRRLEELLDTAQEFGRLGVWQRDLATGRGHWDKHVFRFWGLDPSAGTPSFAEAVKQIHPEDRNAEDFKLSTRKGGHYSQRFRVVNSDGTLRWLHSQWEIKTAANGSPTHAVGVMVDDSAAIAMSERLSEATAKLAIAVDLGEIIIFEQDLHSHCIKMNARGFEILGLPVREQGLSIDEFDALIHPQDREEMEAAKIRAWTERRPVDVQVRYRRHDGQWRHLLSRRVLQRDPLDRPLAMVGVALDVTGRVEAQHAFEETARRLEMATTAAGVGIWSRDTTTGEGYWNVQMFHLNGRDPQLGAPTRDEWLGTMIHPDDRVLMDSVRNRLTAAPDRPANTEYRVIRPDGSVRWLFELARREERDDHVMIFGATLDITDRKNADLALRQANERIALATRGAGIATWEHDLQSNLVRWDDQMFALRGLKMPQNTAERAASAQQLWRSLRHPDEVDAIDKAEHESTVDGSMASHEYRVRWPDGSYRWLASRSIPVRDDGDRLMRRIGVEWDVNERVIAENVRRDAQMAQRQSDAKAALLARMSHELRTPLNAILGFTDLLSREDLTGGEPTTGSGSGHRVERLDHIRRAAEQLLGLVDEVLDLSKIETGELALQPQAVELAPLLRAAVHQHVQKARLRSLRLWVNGDHVSVLADPARLRQILYKLVGHHVDIAPAGSETEIAVSVQDGEARIAISERGPGIPAHQLELFAQPAATAATPPQDLDFGLFGALLNGMNGRVERRFDPGNAERVVMWLPLARMAEAGMRAETDLTSESDLQHARVLYIEDNPVNVILVEQLVEQRGGIEFCSESDGHSGVARAAIFRPDLVLVDIQLPDIDGFEVLRRLRASPQTTRLCCVALSANAMPEDVARARAAGFNDYWTKPIRFSSFLAGLNRLLPARAKR